jgi:hypothetical protein
MGRAARAHNRQIVVLAYRHLDLLAPQHAERARQPSPGRARHDHLVDIAALGGDEGREEPVPVVPGAAIFSGIAKPLAVDVP